MISSTGACRLPGLPPPAHLELPPSTWSFHLPPGASTWSFHLPPGPPPQPSTISFEASARTGTLNPQPSALSPHQNAWAGSPQGWMSCGRLLGSRARPESRDRVPFSASGACQRSAMMVDSGDLEIIRKTQINFKNGYRLVCHGLAAASCENEQLRS
jgi:hypothetical protein